jgi:hypothetical protein
MKNLSLKSFIECLALIDHQMNENFPDDYYIKTFAHPDLPEYIIKMHWNDLGTKEIVIYYKDDQIWSQDWLTGNMQDVYDAVISHTQKIN